MRLYCVFPHDAGADPSNRGGSLSAFSASSESTFGPSSTTKVDIAIGAVLAPRDRTEDRDMNKSAGPQLLGAGADDGDGPVEQAALWRPSLVFHGAMITASRANCWHSRVGF